MEQGEKETKHLFSPHIWRIFLTHLSLGGDPRERATLLFLVRPGVAGKNWKNGGEGRILESMKEKGKPVPFLDGMIAITALEHGLTVATRLVSEFKQTGVKPADPFA